MITYQQIKDWFENKENKQKLVYGICYILVFVVGFGAGSYQKGIRQDSLKPQTNYTTPPSKKPAASVANNEAGLPAVQAVVASARTTSA